MSETPERLYLQLSLEIFSPRNVIIFNIKTQEIRDATSVTCPDKTKIEFWDVIGAKDLSRNYERGSVRTERVVEYGKQFKGGRRTSNKIINRYEGFDACAHQMERMFMITGEELKKMLHPYLIQRFSKLWLATYANAVCGTSNDFFEEKYGEKNFWTVKGAPQRPSWEWTNRFLEEHKSNWRVRILGIEARETRKLHERIAELEKLIKKQT